MPRERREGMMVQWNVYRVVRGLRGAETRQLCGHVEACCRTAAQSAARRLFGGFWRVEVEPR